MRALLIIDFQNDFCPGGALEVPEGNAILPYVKELIGMDWDLIVASKDWHPINHISFASQHGKKPGDSVKVNGKEELLWPDHCIQGTHGSEFYPGWDVNELDYVVLKGEDEAIDSYSAFFDNGRLKSTGLDTTLKENTITDLYCVGLATDYCVKATVLDALSLGYKTHVVLEGVKGVNVNEGDEEKALSEMEEKGAYIISINDLDKF